MAKEEPSLLCFTSELAKCMHCGVCSGSCPSGRHLSLNIRRLLRRARMGKDVFNDPALWMCTTCYTCQQRCPRGINIVDSVLELRRIAVHKGVMLPSHRKVAALLLEHGHAVPIDAENRSKRLALGLSELPDTVHSCPDALDEVKALLGSCGFDELIVEDKE